MVSVIIPAYNSAKFISETLDSVLAQTFQEFEILVINDGSPDTPVLKGALARYSDRIHYIEQKNQGPSAAKNTGIRNASGEFLAFLDSDDIWQPDFLAEQLQFLKEVPSTDMVCSDCSFFGDGELSGNSWQSLDPMEPPVSLEKLLPTHGGAFGSFAILRRSIVKRVGFFDEGLRICEDYNYWLRLLYLGGKLLYSNKVLGKRRRHSGSLTHDAAIVLPHAVRALEKFAAMLDPTSGEAELVRREIARSRHQVALREGRRQLYLGDYEAARMSFASANSELPSTKLKLTLLGLQWIPRWTRWAVIRRDSRLTSRTPTSVATERPAR